MQACHPIAWVAETAEPLSPSLDYRVRLNGSTQNQPETQPLKPQLSEKKIELFFTRSSKIPEIPGGIQTILLGSEEANGVTSMMPTKALVKPMLLTEFKCAYKVY